MMCLIVIVLEVPAPQNNYLSHRWGRFSVPTFFYVEVRVMELRVCNVCGESKPLHKDYFEYKQNKRGGGSYRRKCKTCRNKKRQDDREKIKDEDIVWYKCMEMGNSARARILDKSREYKLSYRGLEFGFRGSIEMATFLYEKFYQDIKDLLDAGSRPSVDRIDNSVGYTRDNIQILDFYDNSCKQGD